MDKPITLLWQIVITPLQAPWWITPTPGPTLWFPLLYADIPCKNLEGQKRRGHNDQRIKKSVPGSHPELNHRVAMSDFWKGSKVCQWKWNGCGRGVDRGLGWVFEKNEVNLRFESDLNCDQEPNERLENFNWTILVNGVFDSVIFEDWCAYWWIWCGNKFYDNLE